MSLSHLRSLLVLAENLDSHFVSIEYHLGFRWHYQGSALTLSVVASAVGRPELWLAKVFQLLVIISNYAYLSIKTIILLHRILKYLASP